MNRLRELSNIDRSGEYLFHHALLNREQHRMLDAVELMRRAVECCPENRRYRLELAHTYAQMGCLRQSDQILLEELRQGGSEQECLYALSLNRASEQDLSRAAHHIMLCHRQAPEDEQTLQLADQIYWRLLDEDSGMRSERLERRRIQRAFRALSEQEPERALLLCQRLLERNGGERTAHAVRAHALLALDRREEALEAARRATEGEGVTALSLILSAQVLLTLDKREAGLSMLEQARQMAPEGADLWMLVRTLGMYQEHQRVSELTRLALERDPYDRWLLHARAVSLVKLGAPNAEAVRPWERILRMDPDDEVAWDLNAALLSGKLKAEELSYDYGLPAPIALERAQALLDLMKQPAETLRERWREDASARRLLKWGLDHDHRLIRRASMHVLMTLDATECRALLRERLLSRRYPLEERMELLKLDPALGHALIGFDVDCATPEEWMLAKEDVDMDGLSVGERQALRWASDVLGGLYGISTLPSLASLYMIYRMGVDRPLDPMNDTEALCTALAYCHLARIGIHTSLSALAREFGGRPRQAKYYLRRLTKTMERVERQYEDL